MTGTSEPVRSWPVGAIALLCALLAACGADRPLVERLEQGEWHPAPFQVASMGGQRAGANISFILRLEGPSDRRLTVEGTVEINPQATLIDGRWKEEVGSRPRAGIVSSATIDFFGGQGNRPSLGGRFTLSTDGESVYRVNLPATSLGEGR